MRKLIILFYLFIIHNFVQAQQDSLFNKSIYQIFVDLPLTNKDKVVIAADSLLNTLHDNKKQQIRVYLRLAMFKVNNGDVLSGIEYAKKAKNIAEKIKDKEWQLRCLGLLASSYRTIGLTYLGNSYIEKAKAINEKLHNPKLDLIISHEEGFYAIVNEDYTELDKIANKLDGLVEKIPNNTIDENIIATNLFLKGEALEAKKKYELAKQNYLEAYNILNKHELNIKGFIVNNLARSYLFTNQLDSALFYLKQAEGIDENTDNFYSRVQTIQLWLEFYKKMNRKDKVLEYNLKLNDINVNQQALLQSVSNDVIQDYNKESSKLHILVYRITSIFILITIIFIISFVYFRNKQKDTKLKIQTLIQQYNQQQFLGQDVVSGMNSDEGKIVKGSYSLSIPESTIEQILIGLTKFEEDKSFLKPEVSLAFVAAKLSTNTKYLSLVIGQNKAKDFSTYINKLRIKYIVEKLISEPEYRNYKISYLAQECGYSTHSKFSYAFKEQIECAPSDFIKEIENIN